MNKIVELIINMEEFEFEDLGVEIMSLVDKPAIEVNWMAFSEELEFRENPDCPDGFEHQMPDGSWMCGKEHGMECDDCYDLEGACWPGYEAIGMKNKNGKKVPNCVPITNSAQFKKDENEAFEKHVIEIAKEVGETVDPEEIIYVNTDKEQFASIEEVLQGIRALDILGNLTDEQKKQDAQIKYRYAGPSGQRTFCATLKALNKIYSREDITRMNRFNPGFGIDGSSSYSVFEYKGGPNCQHFWEQLLQYKDNGRNVLVSIGPAAGDAGMTNNSRTPSSAGSVSNNAYFSKTWSFSDDDQMIVTGPAMIPQQLIARRDDLGNLFHVYFSKDTIEKIARKFLADNNTHNTDINHNGSVVNENTLLESWIVADPKMDKSTSMGFNVPKGTWMTSYKINDEETWKKIKAGELNGFSVEGSFLEVIQKNG